MGSLLLIHYDTNYKEIRIKRSAEIPPDENVCIYRLSSNELNEVVLPLDVFVTGTYTVCIDTIGSTEQIEDCKDINEISVQETNQQQRSSVITTTIDGLCQEILVSDCDPMNTFDQDNNETLEMTDDVKDDSDNAEESDQVQMVTQSVLAVNESNQVQIVAQSVLSINESKPLYSRKYSSVPNDEKPYRCDLCNYSSRYNYSLRTHKRQHMPESARPFKCDQCPAAFNDKRCLQVHLDKHSKGIPHVCEYCEEQYWSKRHLIDHKRVMHPNEPRLHKYSNLVTQFQGVGGGGDIKRYNYLSNIQKCEYCNVKFPTMKEFNAHIETEHSNQKPYRCRICNHTANSKNYLIVHERVHLPESERPFKCDLCSSAFNDKRCLNGHMSKHTGEKPFACNKCGLRFALKKSMLDHQLRHLPFDQRPFKCERCPRSFTTRKCLSIHVSSTHEGIKPLQCAHCSFKTAKKSTISLHVRTHLENCERYVCEFCGTKFKFKPSLMRHSVKCKSLFMFCVHCNYKTKSKKALRTHVFSHLPSESKVRCKYCNGLFKNNQGLSLHNCVAQNWKPIKQRKNRN